MFGGTTFNTPVGINLFNHQFMKDELYEYLIGFGTGVTGVIPGLQIYNKWTNNAALSLGMTIGVYYANVSEQGKYIGMVKNPA